MSPGVLSKSNTMCWVECRALLLGFHDFSLLCVRHIQVEAEKLHLPFFCWCLCRGSCCRLILHVPSTEHAVSAPCTLLFSQQNYTGGSGPLQIVTHSLPEGSRVGFSVQHGMLHMVLLLGTAASAVVRRAITCELPLVLWRRAAAAALARPGIRQTGQGPYACTD